MPDTSARRRTIALWSALALILVATPLVYLNLARSVWDRDPFVYAQFGKEVLSGRRMYTETWQDKPPLAALVYALPQVFVPRSYLAIAFFGGVCLSVAAAGFAYCFRRCPPAALATALFMAFFPATNWQHYSWPSTEIFSNVFITAALLVCWHFHKKRTTSLVGCFVIGVCAMLAFHIRQNTILVLAVPLVAIAQAAETMRHKLLAVAAVGLGGAVTVAGVIMLMLLIGDLPMYFWTIYIYPRSFAQHGSVGEVLGLCLFLWQGPLPFLVALFACLAIGSQRDATFVTACLVAAAAVAVAPFRCHEHYWVSTFPYVALLVGAAIERLSATAERFAGMLAGVMAVVVLPAIVTQTQFATTQSKHADFVELAAMADRVGPKDGTLFVCGEMGSEAVQFASRMSAANVIQWTFQIMPPWDAMLPVPLPEVIQQYVEQPPDVIVARLDFVRRANGAQQPAELAADVRLLHVLTTTFSYRIVAEQGEYIVATRETGP